MNPFKSVLGTEDDEPEEVFDFDTMTDIEYEIWCSLHEEDLMENPT